MDFNGPGIIELRPQFLNFVSIDCLVFSFSNYATLWLWNNEIERTFSSVFWYITSLDSLWKRISSSLAATFHVVNTSVLSKPFCTIWLNSLSFRIQDWLSCAKITKCHSLDLVNSDSVTKESPLPWSKGLKLFHWDVSLNSKWTVYKML